MSIVYLYCICLLSMSIYSLEFILICILDMYSRYLLVYD